MGGLSRHSSLFRQPRTAANNVGTTKKRRQRRSVDLTKIPEKRQEWTVRTFRSFCFVKESQRNNTPASTVANPSFLRRTLSVPPSWSPHHSLLHCRFTLKHWQVVILMLFVTPTIRLNIWELEWPKRKTLKPIASISWMTVAAFLWTVIHSVIGIWARDPLSLWIFGYVGGRSFSFLQSWDCAWGRRSQISNDSQSLLSLAD